MTKDVFLRGQVGISNQKEIDASHVIKNFIIDVLRYQLLSSSLPFEEQSRAVVACHVIMLS